MINLPELKDIIEYNKINKYPVFDLINCDLHNIPKEVFELDHLEKLILSSNKFTEIPSEIKKLKNLRILILYNNKITRLPEEIFSLPNLEGLNLRKNRLTEISGNIKSLVNLKFLFLEENSITNLPNEIGYLEKLEHLRIDSSIQNLPPEIYQKGTRAILSYFKEILANSNVPVNEAKLLLVGSGNVGKTSMMKRLIYNIFNENEYTTEGIDIKKWMTKIKSNIDLRINIWDFGGQEIYHATHQFFLTKRSLYLLIWTARTDDNLLNFDYWLEVIKLLSAGSPVLVILNKIA